MLPATSLVTVTDETFADLVLASDRPVVLDFWAEWCPHCKSVSRNLADLAVEFGDRLRIATINYDEHPVTGRAYRVMSLPTLLIFRDGELAGGVVGARPKSQLRQLLSTYVEGRAPTISSMSP